MTSADVRRQRWRDVVEHRSVDGNDAVVIDLEFATRGEAEAFLGVLRDSVWNDNPVLTGTREASVLEALSV